MKTLIFNYFIWKFLNEFKCACQNQEDTIATIENMIAQVDQVMS